MNGIRIETTIDEEAAKAIPALRPLLGKRVELIAIQTEAEVAACSKTLSVDELLARRIDAPAGSRPLTDDDIRRAIIEGALDGNV